MKYGFLFGAGVEIGYGLPSGGKFALDIFRHDISQSKQEFKKMRDSVNTTTNYASFWLPDNFKDKNISSFGRSVFQNIISDTIGNNRNHIIDKINDFDSIATDEADKMQQEQGVNVVSNLEKILRRELSNIHMGQDIAFIPELQDGNKLFNNSFFAAFLMLYKNKDLLESNLRKELGKIILSIIQLQIGALGESLSHKINDSIFAKKDDEIDLFDDIGEIIQLNYAASGLSGMEYLLDQKKFNDRNDEPSIIVQFAQNIMESIYASVLDYKSLIDVNWHYLYCPKSDWAKFCKICIFLLTVRDYMSSCTSKINIENESGYYHMLKNAIDKGKLDVSAVATTNYNNFISEILKQDIIFLNGGTELWYDPYLNRIGPREKLQSPEGHIVVPLLFTQSGTKPITSIDMSCKYVDTYRSWRESDSIIVVGFGFGSDDEHINGILRTLVDVDDKKLIVVDIEGSSKTIADKLKANKKNNVTFIQVDKQGITEAEGISWIDAITKDNQQ
ncbi:MAG: hypothetical protein K2L07_15840 [Lachnospiraceae bacterium]|nr:hypothetical protein [Lachnospiraceae bacterium]